MSLTRAPYKRKRKSKNSATLCEDDDGAVDTVTHKKAEVNTRHRPKTKCIKVPLPPVTEEHGESSSAGIHDNPGLAPEWNMQEPQLANKLVLQPRIGMVGF